MTVEVALLVGFILARGLLVGAEWAIFSVSRARLEELDEDGDEAAKLVLKLQDEPERFLPAVRVGIATVGILIGAFSATTIANLALPLVYTWSSLDETTIPLVATGLVIASALLLTLIFGELIPQRLAEIKTERYALLMARPIAFFARVSAPVVGGINLIARIILMIFGLRNVPEERVTEEDIKALVREGAEDGEVALQEQLFIESIFKFSDCEVRHIMTPRRDVEMVEADALLGDVLDELLESGYSRFPVYEETPDQVVGLVHVRDLLMLYRRKGEASQVREVIAPPLYVSENSLASILLATFRKNRRHMAVVVSELGGIEGVVTLEDVLEEIVGEIDDEFDEASEEPVVRREDGSWLVDGGLAIDEVKSLLDVEELPGEATFRYDTLAGLVIALLGQLPKTGNYVTWDAWRFEVVDMDGLRIDKVLISQESQGEA
ncbi:HlyC/CorC family transporter [Candidatus Chloroploca sp. M-50]|uniref:HlyC/CorC family transporter n=1 Tax=Candidatus Chloroploca mongolica TaxID=2528176 RepID=A0ABS4D5Z8_9CHLR|nr:hemolysin family protein [Candidatus Chloroploca mongolica]MBP1464853.1 HlyC/CorC family transporter [Candidatus Chloroploca mongolica]